MRRDSEEGTTLIPNGASSSTRLEKFPDYNSCRYLASSMVLTFVIRLGSVPAAVDRALARATLLVEVVNAEIVALIRSNEVIRLPRSHEHAFLILNRVISQQFKY